MAESERQDTMLRAGEYVLGTLADDELRAFEARLLEDGEARRNVAYWEHRLGALGFALAPVEPPEAVWARIARSIDRDAQPHAATDDTLRSMAASGRSRRNEHVGFWRGLAAAACVAAVVMAAMLFNGSISLDQQPADTAPKYASVIYDQPTGMSWLVTANADSHEMSVLAMGDYNVPEGKMLRIWLKPEDSAPILLGKLPHSGGEYRMEVPDEAAASMNQPAQLVVSMEDAARAGTPTPSGKVMWISPIARRTG